MFSRFAQRNQWNDWEDFSDTFAALNAFRHQVDRLFRETENGDALSQGATSELLAQVKDTGEGYVLKAFVPGLGEKDLKLTITEDVLSLSGERSDDTPAGHATHRRERSGYTFARSFSFPAKVDPEQVSAELKDGVLSVKVQKAAEAKPRQITIKSN
ncbi:MAG: Hsp20/alpha crystallin family protein [Deltaproteobacteria bacterium]|nr:Hsp20/alpha crystallin family protein [Deltaproteobacteria bacterium]